MLGGIGDLAGLMKQAKEFQQRLADTQKELQSKRFTGESGGGAVVATVDGKGSLVDVKIQPDAAKDVELLEDLIKSAVGVAFRNSQSAAQQEMSQLTGGLNIPGLSDLLGGGST